MRVKTVTFGFTKNLGNFQSARADVTVELHEGDTTVGAFNLARAAVWQELDMPLDQDESAALLDSVTHPIYGSQGR